MWSTPGPAAENPHSGPVRSCSVCDLSSMTLKSPASTTTSSGRASDTANHAAGPAPPPQVAGRAGTRAMQVRNHERVPVLVGNTDCLDDSRSLAPPGVEVEAKRSCLSAAEASAVQRQDSMVEHAQPRRELNRVSLTCEQRAEQTVIEIGQPPPGADGEMGIGRTHTRSNNRRRAKFHGPRRHLLEAEKRQDRRCSAPRIISSRWARRFGRHGVFPWNRFQLRMSTQSTLLAVRVAPRRPAGVPPWYDHGSACRPCSRMVRSSTLTFAVSLRGIYPAAVGLPPRGASTRCRRESSSARAPPAAEGGWDTASSRRCRAPAQTSLHVQWLRSRKPTSFCAFARPSSSPPTTSCRGARPQARPVAPTAGRLGRVVVHTPRGRETLADLGVGAHVIPHPVYPTAAIRADDGQTLLALRVIRPYKGLAGRDRGRQDESATTAARGRRPRDAARRTA